MEPETVDDVLALIGEAMGNAMKKLCETKLAK